MKVVRLHAHGELRTHDEPEPAPVAGEAMVGIKAVGVCGSDLHWFSEGEIGDAKLEHPLILGQRG